MQGPNDPPFRVFLSLNINQMNIPDEFIPKIKTSLEYSIRNIREYHAKERSRHYQEGRDYPVDYEKESVKRVQNILDYIRAEKNKI